ncbi:MAG TPA: hypothetical protein DCR81_05695, partial [Smithella sp.]|nr:hypothetical protein [Smithella sp.]
MVKKQKKHSRKKHNSKRFNGDSGRARKIPDSLQINQAQAMLNIMKRLREQVWKQCRINHSRIAIDIDTTVETIYGNQQGGRKGHNTKHRGKKGYRPVLCFIEQTREYIYGKLRQGETMSGDDTANVICALEGHLPS